MATLQLFNQTPVINILATLERTNNDVCRALALRIRLCNSDKNQYVGRGMFTDKNGKKADGRGTITACGSKFCPHCVSKSARENFKTARYILDNLVNPKSLTLTLPDSALVGLSLDRQFKIFNYFYRELYRHSNFFQNKKNKPKKIDGTVKGIEFTADKNGNARHVHSHHILDCQFLSYEDLLADVNKAFRVTCNHFGLKFQEVKNLFLREVVEKVTDAKTQVSKKETIQKLSRYLTKPQNWHILKPAELIEMVISEKKYRMFSTSGSCAALARQGRELSKNARERKYQQTATIYRKTLIVPNPLPTPATATTVSPVPAVATPKQPKRIRKKSWRYRIKNKLISLEDYKRELEASFTLMCEFRMVQLPNKYYWVADFRTLDGMPFETWLYHHEKAKKKKSLADKRLKRAVYEPPKAGYLFPQPTAVTPQPAKFAPVIGDGFIGNRKPQPPVVYNF